MLSANCEQIGTTGRLCLCLQVVCDGVYFSTYDVATQLALESVLTTFRWSPIQAIKTAVKIILLASHFDPVTSSLKASDYFLKPLLPLAVAAPDPAQVLA